MQWMGFRTKGKPSVAHNLVWAGKKPFPAYELSFISDRVDYTFIIPKTCCNLALYSAEELPPPPPPVARLKIQPQRD